MMDRQWQLLFELVTHSIWLAGGDGDGVVVVDNQMELRNIVIAFSEWQKTQQPGGQYQIPMTGPHPLSVDELEGVHEALYTSFESTLLFVTQDLWMNQRAKYPSWYGSDITVFI